MSKLFRAYNTKYIFNVSEMKSGNWELSQIRAAFALISTEKDWKKEIKDLFISPDPDAEFSLILETARFLFYEIDPLNIDAVVVDVENKCLEHLFIRICEEAGIRTYVPIYRREGTTKVFHTYREAYHPDLMLSE